MDDFTLRHLQAYIDNAVFDDDREDFTTYALATLADDPGLAEYGWSSMYHTWMDAQ